MEREAVSRVADEAVVSQETREVEAGPNLAELRSYLAQYGEMIVISPRLPGVPLPLVSLINACPKPPTEETAPQFLAEAQMLVAAAQEKKPESKDDEETEEDTDQDSDQDESKKKLI